MAGVNKEVLYIGIYAQQCLQAGQRCWDDDRWLGEDEDGELISTTNDVVLYKGTRPELLAEAKDLEGLHKDRKPFRPGDTYYLRVAQTLQEACE